MELKFKRALGRLLEAQVDLETAKILLAKEIHSRSLFHSQQCVEKASKACLTVKFAGEIRSHLVIGLFKREILPLASESLKKEFGGVLDKAMALEKRWIDTRYEEVDVEKEELRVPSLIFKVKDAEEGIKVAEKVSELSRKFLEEYFKERIPSNLEDLKEFIRGGE